MDAVVLENVTKEFMLGFKRKDRALFKFASLVGGFFQKKKFTALENINMVIPQGAKLGIIGENGSGKSTLLRIIAGIYQPTKGTITTNGNVMYISGFGMGLNQKLTFRENVYLIGSLMGLSNRQIKSKLKEIVDFSGLEEFLDVKLERFSTGMLARAGFSSRIFFIELVNPEIILLDEAINGGGDLEFSKKANEQMKKLLSTPATVIMASHSLDILQKLCTQVVWIKKGHIESQGEKPKSVVNKYTKSFA